MKWNLGGACHCLIFPGFFEFLSPNFAGFSQLINPGGKFRKYPEKSGNFEPWARISRGSHSVGPVLPEVSRVSFPCVRAGGKDTPAKSQPLVIYGLKLKKYFANRVARLAKRQSTRSQETGSLHRCTTLHAMQCRDLQRPATICNG